MDPFIVNSIRNTINSISFFSPASGAKLAIKLFSTPFKGRILEEEKQYLKTAVQEDVYCKNFKIKTYRWGGKKETILLVHGWESNAFRWKNLIEYFKTKDYNIIAIDAPAHGASGSKTFNAVMYSDCIYDVTRHFEIDYIIGHSIGGTASALSISSHSIKIKKLVMLGSPSNFESLVSNYTRLMKFSKRVTKAMDAYFIKNFGNLPNYYNASLFAKNIWAKCLIIHDKQDKVISYRDALENKKAYKNSELIKTQGLGHGLKAQEVYEHILTFLEH